VATVKKTEIEVRGDGAAAGDPGVASQAEVGARSRRACVETGRDGPVDAKRASDERDRLPTTTHVRYACPMAGRIQMVGRGK
jgi:hypothetical protein